MDGPPIWRIAFRSRFKSLAMISFFKARPVAARCAIHSLGVMCPLSALHAWHMCIRLRGWWFTFLERGIRWAMVAIERSISAELG